MDMGVPTPARGEPPAHRELLSLSLASFSPVFYVSSCRYKGGFVTPPVCEERGPWLTFGKTDCECLAGPALTAHGSGDRHRVSHGSAAKGLLAAFLPTNASCERLFSGERGGRWRGGLTLSLRAASPLRAALPARGSGQLRRDQVGHCPGINGLFSS